MRLIEWTILFIKEKTRFVLWALFFLCFHLSVSASAKTMKTSYLQFETPDFWSCSLKKKVWVCKDLKTFKNNIILSIVAKKKTPEDSFKKLLDLSKKNKEYLRRNGNTQVSQLKKAGIVILNKKKWVETLHLAGEAPNYYTYYLSAIIGDRVILVSYSYHKQIEVDAKKIYQSISQSLRALNLKAKKSSVNKKEFSFDKPSRKNTNSDSQFPSAVESVSDSETSNYNLYLLLIGIVVIFVFYLGNKVRKN